MRCGPCAIARAQVREVELFGRHPTFVLHAHQVADFPQHTGDHRASSLSAVRPILPAEPRSVPR